MSKKYILLKLSQTRDFYTKQTFGLSRGVHCFVKINSKKHIRNIQVVNMRTKFVQTNKRLCAYKMQ